jgi:hypothetical protein
MRLYMNQNERMHMIKKLQKIVGERTKKIETQAALEAQLSADVVALDAHRRGLVLSGNSDFLAGAAMAEKCATASAQLCATREALGQLDAALPPIFESVKMAAIKAANVAEQAANLEVRAHLKPLYTSEAEVEAAASRTKKCQEAGNVFFNVNAIKLGDGDPWERAQALLEICAREKLFEGAAA